MGRKQHKFHGDPARFEVLADFIAERYGNKVKYIADVAGGQGMLSRILQKKYNYESDVIDPRGWALKGINSRKEEFTASMADYYDLIVGLHADEATRPIAEAALVRPTILITCCNFWSEDKLGQEELLYAIESFYKHHNINFERVIFNFKGPKNAGLVTEPPNRVS